MEASRCMNESVRRAPKPSRAFPTTRPFVKRKQTVVTVEETDPEALKMRIQTGEEGISFFAPSPMQYEESDRAT